MNELVVTILRLGYLALLWVFVLGAIGVLRRDIYGTKVIPRRTSSGRRDRSVPAAPTPYVPLSTPHVPEPQDAIATQAVGSGGAGGPTKLVITQGGMSGTVIPLTGAPITIGRHPSCTLELEDDFASNQHARIYPDADRWYLEDMGSTNGTYLGRDRVSDSVPVRPGEPIRIGRTVLELQR